MRAQVESSEILNFGVDRQNKFLEPANCHGVKVFNPLNVDAWLSLVLNLCLAFEPEKMNHPVSWWGLGFSWVGFPILTFL